MDIARFLLLLLFVVVLSACGPKTALTRSDISMFYKGAPSHEVSAIAEIPARCSLAPVDDKSIRVDVYPLSDTHYLGDYFLLYVDDQLRFWGYPYEYARSTDRLISDVGSLISHATFCVANPPASQDDSSQ
jgi:hypothetical protein